MTKIEFDEPSKVELISIKEPALEIRNNGFRGDGIKGVGLQKEGAGVVGQSEIFEGVHGEVMRSGFGVFGTTNGPRGSGAGVVGVGNSAIGVMGESKDDVGVSGTSETSPGVRGVSQQGVGVLGTSRDFFGVQGHAEPTCQGAILANGGKHALVAQNGIEAAGRFIGDVEVIGDIRMVNADCAEDFDITDSETKENVEAGTVMVLTENGSLQQSYQEYDKKVAGIVSGASGYKPAIVLDRHEQQQQDQNNTNNKNSSRLPIALMGKVYCKVDARNSSIEIGDLLTTSSTKGYAMKAQDPMKAFGAVIGKALGSIKQGTMGMIPVLVALQ